MEAHEEQEESEITERYDSEDDTGDDMPPAPSAFPPDWDLATAVVEAVSDPETSKSLARAAVSDEPSTQPVVEDDVEPQIQQVEEVEEIEPQGPAKTDPAPAALESAAGVQEDLSIKEAPAPLPPYILSPIRPSDGDHVNMITVVLRSTGDKVRDNLRIRQIYGTLITYPGNDRFAFQVFERGRGYLIEFPNFTTGLCPELIGRLKTFIPNDQLRIESITFQ